MTATERKLQSENKLASLGIVLKDELPPIEDEHEADFKSARQIAKRILVLVYLNCVAFDRSLQQEVMMFLTREKLWDEASDREKSLFQNPKWSENEVAEILWRAESIWVMLWAINKVRDLDLPIKEVQVEDIFALLPGFFESTNGFVDSAETRANSEILDEADFNFRLSWAIYEASKRDEILPHINGSVANQRYTSLNWIVGIRQDWEG